ncbi:hypothetical protein B0H14DRAFT_2600974 [Mycena olivaceomarginata]|nr:hypothetical protein B0H14DRAFT_2600974 [Mycena olivaceomarginata]
MGGAWPSTLHLFPSVNWQVSGPSHRRSSSGTAPAPGPSSSARTPPTANTRTMSKRERKELLEWLQREKDADAAEEANISRIKFRLQYDQEQSPLFYGEIQVLGAGESQTEGEKHMIYWDKNFNQWQTTIAGSRTTDVNNPLRPNKEIMKLADKFNGENILGASYLPPGCFHDIVGAPGAPTKYCWVLPVYLIGMLGAPGQKLLGDPSEFDWEHPGNYTKAVGSFQDVTWAVPSPLRNIVGGSQDYYKGAPMACRSVMNPAEAGSAFCAPVEGGCRSAEGGDAVNPAKGKKHSMPAEEGGDE